MQKIACSPMWLRLALFMDGSITIDLRMVQATRVGIRRIFYYRKAMLQRQAEGTGYMPAGREELDMHDYIKGAGGAMFENTLVAIVLGDNNMARMVAILNGGVLPCNPPCHISLVTAPRLVYLCTSISYFVFFPGHLDSASYKPHISCLLIAHIPLICACVLIWPLLGT